MQDFSKPYRGVGYFGLWADETADDYGRRDAMAILADAVTRCIDDDMRERPEVTAALAYLSDHGGHFALLTGFRKALDTPHPLARQAQARAVYDALARSMEQKAAPSH